MPETKAYFIMRQDLNMSQVKFGIQIGHGTDFIHTHHYGPEIITPLIDWKIDGRKKIILEVDNLNQLEKVIQELQENSVSFGRIVDLGLTELPPNTTTGIVVYPINDEKKPRILKKLQNWKEHSSV